MGGDRRKSWVDGLLAAPGDDPPELARSKLRSFRRLLLLIVAAEAWHALHLPAFRQDEPLHAAIAGALSLCAGLAWRVRFERAATGAAFVAIAAGLMAVFPENANHQYVSLVATGLLWLRRDAADELFVLQALRWLVPIAFFWAGVQKVFHGYYFGGEFLAVRIATDPSFATLLAPLLSPEELARLSQLAPGRGSGPYRVSEGLFLLVSNVTWLAELALAPLLLVSATRIFAAAGVIAFMMAIELAARELFFGMMMVSLALLYLPRDANRRTSPMFAAAIAVLLATSAGLLPGWSFG